MVENNPTREIIAQVLDVRNIKVEKKSLNSLIGFEGSHDKTLFSHRPYNTTAELWGTERSIFYKAVTKDEKLKIEILEKSNKVGSAIIPLDRKQKDGEITKEWYPLQPAGEVQVSLKWNTVLAKVDGRNEVLTSVFGSKPYPLADLQVDLPRHERPYWKEYLVRAENILKEGVPLPATTIMAVLKGSLESSTKRNRVRVFVSSTFTDTEIERNRLMADVYPYLSLLCKKLGLEFETVDMRWGVREFTNDNHQTSELCMKELHKCRNLSVGPAFLCLLGNKYGYRPFPAKITQEILNTMWTRICEDESPKIKEKAVVDKLKGSKVETVLETLNDSEKSLISSVSDMLFIPTWFRLDKNSNPPVFDLQNITTLLPNFRSTVAAERNQASSTWWKIFEAIQLLLRHGASALPKEEQEKFIISVTNEEVFHGILNNKDFRTQSVCIARRVNDIESVKEDGALKKFVDASFSSPSPLSIFENKSASNLTLDCEATSLLSHLKHTVANQLASNSLLDYVVENKHLGEEKDGTDDEKKRNGQIQELYLREICEVVCKALGDRILDGFQSTNYVTPTVFPEVVQHHSFLKLKLRGYVPREKLEARIIDYCLAEDAKIDYQSDEVTELFEVGDSTIKMRLKTNDMIQPNKAFVVYAESGAGKTALMAYVANKIHQLHPSSSVITRFLGTTPFSSDVLPLVRGLCSQLMVILDQQNPANEQIVAAGTIEEATALFKDLLQYAKGKDRVFIFIDSIDQLLPNNNAYMLDWLPLEIPDNVRIVVSVLVASEEEEANPNLVKSRPPDLYAFLRVLYEKYSNKDNFFLNIPQLVPSEAEQIVDNRLRIQDANGWGRVLTPEQKSVVLKSSSASFTPLYLSIALDLAAQWKSYTPISECSLAGTTREIILQLFRKLEAVHGKVLVSHALGYLTASRYGLSSQDMEDILSCDDEVLNDVYQWWVPPVRRLPPLLWKRLKEDLSGYLVEKGLGAVTLSSWFHRQFKEAAEDYYLSGDAFLARYRALARYFDGSLANTGKLIPPQPLEYSAQQLNTHKMSSLPYSQSFCLEPTQFQSSLYNLEFIEYKLRAGMAGDLIADYDFAVALLQKDPQHRATFMEHIKKLKAVQDFLKGNLNFLVQLPSSILMAALNQPEGSIIHTLATEQRSKPQVLLLLNKQAPLTGVLTLEGNEAAVNAHFERDEERIVVHHYNCIKVWDVATALELQNIPKENSASAVLPGEKIVCRLNRKTRVIDATNGVELKSYDRVNQSRVFIGSPDEKLLLSLGFSDSGVTPVIYDVETFNYLFLMQNMPRATYGHFSSDGKLVFASASGLTSIDVYETKTGTLVRSIGNGKAMRYATFGIGGKYIYSTDFDGELYTWNMETGESTSTKAHNAIIHFIVVSPLGDRIATCSQDMTAKLWDVSSSEPTETFHLKGHRIHLQRGYFSHDGKTLATVAESKVILWDVYKGELLTSLLGHSAQVTSLRFSKNNRKVLTGSVDRTVRIWDLDARDQPIAPFDSHDREVVKCAHTADGKYAVTASDDQTIKVWDSLNAKLLRSLPQDKNWEPNFFISPSGEFILTIVKKTVVVINLLSGETVTILKAHARELYPFCVFSSTGLMATHSDKEAKIWDTKTWKELKKFTGHDEAIHRCIFSPDGSQLVTVSTDTLAVWNVKTGKRIHDLAGPDIEAKYLEFSGKYLMASLGNTVNQWTFDPPEVTSKDLDEATVQVGVTRGVVVATYGSDNSFVAFDAASLDPLNGPLHYHKALPRFVTYEDEVWSYAYNEIVKYTVKDDGKKVEKKGEFFVPFNISCLSRSASQLVCCSPQGTVSFFNVQ